jgi:NAD(P)-dependent dehydrogenase (short-subunit alcohol dehydrogenase family)
MNTVLITGSGKRLGRQLALNFAKFGWNIILHHFHSDDSAVKTYNEIKALGVEVYSVKFDISKPKEIEKGFDEITHNFHFPNVLVNNAAIFPKMMKIEDIDEEHWDTALGTNLKGTFFVSKEFAKYAPENSRIINIASSGAFEIWKHRIPYNVSKSGVITLTKALARELAPKISVNSVSPGMVDITDETPVEPLIIGTSKIPFGRYATSEEIFEAVNFFATCTSYITGQNLTVDGGFGLVR